jgi:hypothetical protein
MRKKINWKKYSIIALALITSIFLLTRDYLVKRDITLSCNYMAYACGEDCEQYAVVEAIPNSPKAKIVGQDVYAEFANNKMEDLIKKEVGICGICYVYVFKGDLYFSLIRNCNILRVKSFNLKLKSKDCCNN